MTVLGGIKGMEHRVVVTEIDYELQAAILLLTVHSQALAVKFLCLLNILCKS